MISIIAVTASLLTIWLFFFRENPPLLRKGLVFILVAAVAVALTLPFSAASVERKLLGSW
ncbi:MAG: hypothetical protein AAFW73_11810 [Bacteroidota bacterium]